MTTAHFSKLPLADSTLRNLEALGMTAMTPIQTLSLPEILQGKDLIAQARTGSGKTAAFGLGLLHALQRKQFQVQALVICPTRELADQVAQSLRNLARMSDNVKVLTLTGGAPLRPQGDSLQSGVHVVVGTPGRLLKHLEQGSLQLGQLRTLVLDEADRMLEMGFLEEVEKIVAYAPRQRQTLLFSATYPAEIEQLSQQLQQQPVRIEAEDEVETRTIEESFYRVNPKQKMEALIRLLAHHQPAAAMIFTNTKQEAKTVAEQLRRQWVDALAIHGDLDQMARTDTLVQFANGSCPVLVATDVAARGLDIPAMGMVVNYDLPKEAAAYIHRIGRTGRSGERGIAAALITDRQQPLVEQYARTPCRCSSIEALPPVEGFSMRGCYSTLVVGGGKRDKIRAGDLLGALTGAAGIAGDKVGKIDINPRQSYVAIEREVADQAAQRLRKGRIKKRKLTVRRLR